MQAHRSPANVILILNTLKDIRLVQELSVLEIQRLLGLMAAAANIISLGLLKSSFHHLNYHSRVVRILRCGLCTLRLWKKPGFLNRGLDLGACCHLKSLLSNASIKAWDAVLDGRPASGLWEDPYLSWHINCLEIPKLPSAPQPITLQSLFPLLHEMPEEENLHRLCPVCTFEDLHP